MRITISSRSLTSAEIDRRVESIVLRRLRPSITPSITRPIKPGRLILSNSDRITIERMIIAETLRIILPPGLIEMRRSNSQKLSAKKAVLEDCSPRQASLPRELYSPCVILSMTSERR
jgi:hypothetical protein